jgi:tRNA (guanine37-N1)-methyltransferase
MFSGLKVSAEPCLRVPKILGEKAIVLLNKLGFLNRELKIQQVMDSLFIPLVRKPLPADIKRFEETLPNFKISTHKFPKRTKRSLKLVDLLEDKLPPHLLASLPHAIDFVGDVAVIEVPPELESHKRIVGEAVLKAHKRIRTVLAKSGAVEGVYRVREFDVIVGIGKTETVHREYGCMFYVDLAKAYFSPRLSHEHDRVASQVKDGETVIDMFAGVGPFSVLIAKRHKNVRVYAVDVNPDAVNYLKKNIEANHVGKSVTPLLSDVRQIVKKKLVGVADRVIMNLPEKAIEYVDVACEALKPEGGVVHYYEFTSMPEPLETAKVRLIEAMKQTDRNVKKILSARLVRATAPYTWQVVVDVEIQ